MALSSLKESNQKFRSTAAQSRQWHRPLPGRILRLSKGRRLVLRVRFSVRSMRWRWEQWVGFAVLAPGWWWKVERESTRQRWSAVKRFGAYGLWIVRRYVMHVCRQFRKSRIRKCCELVEGEAWKPNGWQFVTTTNDGKPQQENGSSNQVSVTNGETKRNQLFCVFFLIIFFFSV